MKKRNAPVEKLIEKNKKPPMSTGITSYKKGGSSLGKDLKIKGLKSIKEVDDESEAGSKRSGRLPFKFETMEK